MRILSLKYNLILSLLIIAALAIKTWLQLSGALPFNSDEAIVGLMARHIIKLGERPIFFYGQSYMGSLDAYLVALGFTLLGQKVWVIRLVQSLLYTGTLITTFLLGKAIFESKWVGLLAVGLLAVPVVNVTLYTTVSIGGYGEALLLGNLILLVALNLTRNVQVSSALSSGRRKITCLIAGWGFLVGLGLWVNGLTIVYSFPTALLIAWILVKGWKVDHLLNLQFVSSLILVMITGFFLGSLPWWIYALQNGLGGLVSELLGGAVAVESGSWFARSINHLLYFVLFGTTAIFGIRPPWDIKWLALPLLPFILAIWGWITYSLITKAKIEMKFWQRYAILVAVMACVLAGFILTPFGTDPSGRYFLPFAVPLSLMAADQLLDKCGKGKLLGPAIYALLLVFNLAGTIQCTIENPPGITTQFDSTTIIDHRFDEQLISFLKDKDELTGYTNYWVAYPLAFLSNEELIFIPRLPYHQDLRFTSRDDRYAQYDDIIKNNSKVAYITTHNKQLDDKLRQELTSKGVSWREKQIGDYLVYYRLSTPIRPWEMELSN